MWTALSYKLPLYASPEATMQVIYLLGVAPITILRTYNYGSTSLLLVTSAEEVCSTEQVGSLHSRFLHGTLSRSLYDVGVNIQVERTCRHAPMPMTGCEAVRRVVIDDR